MALARHKWSSIYHEQRVQATTKSADTVPGHCAGSRVIVHGAACHTSQAGSIARDPSSGRARLAWAASRCRTLFPHRHKSLLVHTMQLIACTPEATTARRTPSDGLTARFHNSDQDTDRLLQGGGRAFGREGSSYREGSAQPDTPAAGRRGGAMGERSRFGPAPPDTVGFAVVEGFVPRVGLSLASWSRPSLCAGERQWERDQQYERCCSVVMPVTRRPRAGLRRRWAAATVPGWPPAAAGGAAPRRSRCRRRRRRRRRQTACFATPKQVPPCPPEIESAIASAMSAAISKAAAPCIASEWVHITAERVSDTISSSG
jgi:hypothetical protein